MQILCVVFIGKLLVSCANFVICRFDVFISFTTILVEALESLMCKISSENKGTFNFSFPIYIPLVSFSLFIALAKASSTTWNRYREGREQPSLSFSSFCGNVLVTLHLGWYWLCSCWELPVSWWSKPLVFPVSPGLLWWRDVKIFSFCLKCDIHLVCIF